MVADHGALAHAHRHGFELVRAHTERFIAYIRGLTPEDVARPVPGLDWTVGETVTHVRSVYERYTTDSTRAATAHGVARQNAADITRLGVDVAGAASAIAAQLQLLGVLVDRIEPERTFPFHAGQQITMAGGWGNLLGELLAHGDDIARATGSPFGIPGADLEILWHFTLPVLAGWLGPEAADLEESWELRMPFGTVRFALVRGALQMGGAAGDLPQHHVVGVDDVETATLTVPYRRRTATDPELALLAARFVDL